MANPEHVEIYKQGTLAISEWHGILGSGQLDLSGADLRGTYLGRPDLRSAYLRDLYGKELGDGANGLGQPSANLVRANLSGSDLSGTNLSNANLSAANLTNANLNRTQLAWTQFNGASLTGASMEDALMLGTRFGNVDLSEVIGLTSVWHVGPSTIGVDTLYKSRGIIPEAFLRGCGVTQDLIAYLPSFFGTMDPVQYQSCFISYSSKDDSFARRLHERLRTEKLRVWFAPEDMKGGRKLIEQIDDAIQVNDRLLLVLSDASMQSEWVMTEIRRARKTELREKRQKLFPIRLVTIKKIRNWTCFDSDTGKDLATEIREYHIPDFSNWKDHDALEKAMAALLAALRASV